MALTSGTKLGPYEIQSPLGEGGMGEVYRARDTRLDRSVAIKVLASHTSRDDDSGRKNALLRRIEINPHARVVRERHGVSKSFPTDGSRRTSKRPRSPL